MTISGASKKFCMVSIIGAPNAGKSTLLNKLLRQKISIVTPKVQTTRARITGILTEGDVQLVFLDTPGIFRPQKKLDKAMVKTAWSSIEGVDVVLVMVDVAKRDKTAIHEIIFSLSHVRNRETKYILLLNKIDKIEKHELLAITKELNGMFDFDKTFMISAMKGEGLNDLKNYLKQQSRLGQWLYPEDEATTIPMKLYVAEITREKLMMQLEHELPYQLMVETESYKEVPPSGKDKRGSVTIHQIIYVTTEGQKKIVVGKGGQGIKKTGESARKELEKIINKKVNLFLFVKVKENWQDSKESYEIMGLGEG